MKDIYPWQKKDIRRLHELRKRPPNAVLFKGTKGIGKFDLAMNFAQSLLCQNAERFELACGSCSSCRWFEQESHPDFRLLQPEESSRNGEETETGKKPSKQISVDQVRALADFVGMSAHQGGKRVVVIYPAEAMNANAANALLKNLEEPPQDLLFILVSHKPQQLLPTILSRCISLALTAPDTENSMNWLKDRGVKHPAEALAASGYSPLQAAQSDPQLGSGERDKLLRALRLPASMDVFAIAETLHKIEQILVVQWLQQWCYDLVSMKLSGRLRYHPGEEATIRILVEPVDTLRLTRMQKLLQTAKLEARHTLNTKLFFESLLFVYRRLMLG